MADLVERPHGIKLYRNDETGLLRKFSYRPRHGRWTLMYSVDRASLPEKEGLIERLHKAYAGCGLELLREAAAALEAEASEGERRGLERALELTKFEAEAWGHVDGSSARVAAAKIERALALIPEAPVRECE